MVLQSELIFIAISIQPPSLNFHKMKLPSALAFLYAALFQRGNAVTFSGSSRKEKASVNELKSSFSGMLEGQYGELSKSNAECIDGAKDFQILTVRETSRKAAAETYGDRIEFSKSGLTETHLGLRDLIRHESTHAALRIINERFGYHGAQPRAPYSNDAERKEYESALKDFNQGLKKIEKKLVKILKNGKDDLFWWEYLKN